MVNVIGTVKWFNDAKAFGFIRSDDGDDFICHKWHIITEPQTLKEQQRVCFHIIDGEAKNVTVLETPEVPKHDVNKPLTGNCTVYCNDPLIVVFDNVVPLDFCQQIIDKHTNDTMNPNSGLQSRTESYAQVTEQVENRGISLGMDPYHYDLLATKISECCEMPISLIEAIDIYNYEVGQYLDLHHDYPYDPKQINYYKLGGDRVGTGIFFLNDNFEGGITKFPKLGVEIKPTAGSFLYFRQSYDEEKNWSTIHESSLITEGCKWIASCFFADRNRAGFIDRSKQMIEENPEFTDKFYIKKFMEIQQGNIQLWRKLQTIKENIYVKEIIEKQYGSDFFDDIDDLVK